MTSRYAIENGRLLHAYIRALRAAYPGCAIVWFPWMPFPIPMPVPAGPR